MFTEFPARLLAALTHPEALGYLPVRVPFDSNDRFHYYTIEYRTPDSWDSGIPASIVMINENKNNGSYYQTTLRQRQLGSYAGTGDGPPLQTITANGVSVSVQSTSGDQATVQVSTQYALACAQGYVWREASEIDRVCVTPATRSQAAADNSAAGSRHLPNSKTCVQGYVSWGDSNATLAETFTSTCLPARRFSFVFAQYHRSDHHFGCLERRCHRPDTCDRTRCDDCDHRQRPRIEPVPKN